MQCQEWRHRAAPKFDDSLFLYSATADLSLYSETLIFKAIAASNVARIQSE